jgi:large conductance mechanosensitive channel
MGMLQDFKSFAIKGNMVDMAVGIIIGAAFGKIISSLVKDILMPPIGLLIGGVDFTDLAYTLKEAKDGAEAVAINYGSFAQNVIDFLIVAMAIFVAVKVIQSMQRKEEEQPSEPPKPTNEEQLLTEIRDLLKQNT